MKKLLLSTLMGGAFLLMPNLAGAQDQIYLIGDPQGWKIDNADMPLPAIEQGVYQATFNIEEGDAIYFRFYTELGDWEENSIGATPEDGNTITVNWTDGEFSGEWVYGKGSWLLENWDGGDIEMTVNLNNNTVLFTTDVEILPPVNTTYTVYAYNSEGWNDMYLYLWGAVNDLTGAWPGSAPVAITEIAGVPYYTFTFEIEPGMTENLIFNNNAGVQTNDYQVVFGEENSIYVNVVNGEVEAIDPATFEPSTGGDAFDGAIYIVGSPQEWSINSNAMPVPQVSEDIYEFTYYIPAGKFMFRFYSELGDWDSNSIGSQVEDNPKEITFSNGVSENESYAGKGSWTYSAWPGGNLTIQVNLSTNTVSFISGVDLGNDNPNPGGDKEIYTVYAYNSEGWNDMYLYLWGDVNDLTGAWPGCAPVSITEINGVPYYTYKFSAAIGSEEKFIFNNFATKQTSDYPVVFGEETSIYVNIVNENVMAVDPATFEPTVGADKFDDALYLVGLPQGWNINGDTMPVPEISENVYEFTYYIPEGEFRFRFYSEIGDWDSNSIGSQVEDNPVSLTFNSDISDNTAFAGKGSWDYADWAGGNVTMLIDLNNNKVKFGINGRMPEVDQPQAPVETPDLWLVGALNDWKLDNFDYAFSPVANKEGVYTLTIDVPAIDSKVENPENYSNFKLAYGLASDWSETYGQDGAPFALYGTEAYSGAMIEDGENWVVSNWAGGKLTITVDLKKEEISISGSKQPALVAGDKLYLIGAPQQWDIDSDAMALEETEKGVYTGTFSIPVGEFQFIFYTALGDWESNYIGAVNVAGGNYGISMKDNVYEGEATFSKSNWQFKDWTGGEVIITVDINDMTVNFDANTTTSGIDRLQNVDEMETIYNLQGVKLTRDELGKGIYIINGKKVVVK